MQRKRSFRDAHIQRQDCGRHNENVIMCKPTREPQEKPNMPTPRY